MSSNIVGLCAPGWALAELGRALMEAGAAKTRQAVGSAGGVRMRCRGFEAWKPDGGDCRFPEDVKQIVATLRDAGIDVEPDHAEAAYTRVSVEDYHAGWLELGQRNRRDDAWLVKNMVQYLEPAREDT